MQARILARLRDEGPLSRVQLADRLSVSRTTIARRGVPARPSSAWPRRSARPPPGEAGARPWSTSPRHPLRRHLDRGDRPVRRASPTAGVGVLARRITATATSPRAPSRCSPSRSTEARALLDELGVERPMGAGIAVPGPVDYHRGVPVSPPIMPGWDGYPVRDAVARELGCPAVLDNDVNAMALGEQHAGVARSARDFLFVKIGTGIGCGIVVDGELYRGVDGCAGDIGHIRVEDFGPTCACGNTGCLEAFAGGAALARDATAAARAGRSPRPGRAARGAGRADRRRHRARCRPGRRPGGPADPRRRSPGRTGAGRAGVLLQPRPDRHRRSGHRAGSRTARGDPRGDLPPLAPARHRQPADRAERARRRERRHRRRPPGQQLCLRALCEESARESHPGRRDRLLDPVLQGRRPRRRDRRAGPQRPGRAPRGHRGRPGRLVGGAAGGGGGGRGSRRRRGRVGRRPAARHGRARRGRRGACDRRCCGTTPGRRRPRRTSSPSSAAARRGPTPSGSVPVASFTITKLRWLAEHEPEHAERAPRRCASPTTG